jgi:hypothetical protein
VTRSGAGVTASPNPTSTWSNATRGADAGLQANAHAAVGCVITDGLGAHRCGIELHGIVLRRHARQILKDTNQVLVAGVPEAEQVGVTGGAMRLGIPEVEKQGTLEQEAVCMWRFGEPVQQPLQRIAVQQQAVVIALLLCQPQQLGQHRRGGALRRHATSAST